MVIEWLTLRTNPAYRDALMECDRKIWTTALSTYSGFIDKEVWLDPANPGDIILVIRWQSRAEWKSISPHTLAELEQQFQQLLPCECQIIDAREYELAALS